MIPDLKPVGQGCRLPNHFAIRLGQQIVGQDGKMMHQAIELRYYACKTLVYLSIDPDRSSGVTCRAMM